MGQISLLSVHAELEKLQKIVSDLQDEVDENREHIKQLEKKVKK